MSINIILKIIIAVAIACACARALIKVKHPFGMATLNAIGGIASIGIINMLAQYTGASLALNYATAFIACVLGAPGIIAIMVARPFLL